MRLVCPDVQKGRKRIVMNMLEVQGYLDGSFMSTNSRQVPRVL